MCSQLLRLAGDCNDHLSGDGSRLRRQFGLGNRTLHCGITGPLFLVAGLVSLLSETRFIYLEIDLALPFVLTGVGIAFYSNGAMRGTR